MRRQSSPGDRGGVPAQPMRDTRSQPHRATTQGGMGRQRPAHDSDMDENDSIAIPRTNTDDDLESGG